MENFLKYLGVFLVLIGVGVLVYYTYGTPSNALLVTAASLMIVGVIEFIVANKMLK